MTTRQAGKPGSRHPRSRRLSTRGRCVLAGGIAAGICGIILNERDLVRIGILAALLPLVALVVMLLRQPRLRVSFHPDSRQYERGRAGTIAVAITNVGRIATPVLDVTIPATDSVTPGASVLIPALRPRRTARLRYRVHAWRRGRFTTGPAWITATDPLGMCTIRTETSLGGEILVTPATVTLTGIPPAVGSGGATSTAVEGTAARGEPDVIVRSYQPGDDIRLIAWRASARSNDTMVRTFQAMAHDSAAIMIDHRARHHVVTGFDNSLELAVSLTASLGLHLMAGGYDIAVTNHRATVLSHGATDAVPLLTELADIGPDDHDPLTPAPAGDTNLVIAVLGDLDAAEIPVWDDINRHASHRIAFLIDTAGWGTARPAGRCDAAAADLRDRGWTVVIVRRGDDLAAAWQTACDSDRLAGRYV